jgi:hypothetical protein
MPRLANLAALPARNVRQLRPQHRLRQDTVGVQQVEVLDMIATDHVQQHERERHQAVVPPVLAQAKLGARALEQPEPHEQRGKQGKSGEARRRAGLVDLVLAGKRLLRHDRVTPLVGLCFATEAYNPRELRGNGVSRAISLED